jgi:hypothetical protein
MPDLNFEVVGAEARTHAASPLLVFKMRASNSDPSERIQNVALQCQLQLQVMRRQYSEAEKRRLRDLFGEPARWSDTLRTMFWTRVNVNIPAFAGVKEFDLEVPCTFDFNIAATKLFYGLEDGDVPIELLFNGTIFHQPDDGLQVSQIPWSKSAKFRLPVRVWQDMMDHYFPNSCWLRLRRDVFDKLYQYKIDGGIPTWEQAIERLLANVEEQVIP